MTPPETEATAEPVPPPDRYAAVKRWGTRIVAVVLLAAAGWVIWRQLHHLSWHELRHAFADWGWKRVALSVAAVVASYLTLAINEWAGLRWAGAKVGPWTVLLGSFCFNAFAHALGTAVVVSAAVRLKVYAGSGVTMAQIVKTTAFFYVSFGLGLVAIAGGGLVTAPEWRLAAVHLAPEVARIAGWALLGTIPAYVVLCAWVRGTLNVLGLHFILPSWPWALAQIVIGVVDNILTVLIPWVLLPPGLVGLGAFTGAFAVATVTGVISSVPGGAGVFESVLLTLLPHADRAPLVAAFVGYRLFYFLIPLGLAGIILAVMGRAPKTPDAPSG
jgi:uncharacterized membrane protein YbhN (UPF0104 family)